MKRSTNRILTTHTGSLPRTPEVIEMLKAKEEGKPVDQGTFIERVRGGVVDLVRNQVNSGVDVPNDGELSKPGWNQYVKSRVGGMTVYPGQTAAAGGGGNEIDYPGFTQFMNTRTGGLTAGQTKVEVTGPLSYKGQSEVQMDIENLKSALKGQKYEEAFLPSASIGVISRIDNKHYPTFEAYIRGIADVMKHEYEAITKAGLILQIDAPEMVIDKNRPEWRDKTLAEYRKGRMDPWVEALNYALANIPAEQVRFHVCWGNTEGPHNRDIQLKDIVDIVLKVKAQAYSVEASNPRHAHEWKVWRDARLPEGKAVIPGTIDSTTNFVEHPELVADRIMSYANIVGRENVIASTDCGFATGAFRYNPVYTPIVWGKLKTMAEGAAMASRELWRR